MAKIATDISQSKILAKILPHETADMYWSFGNIKFMDHDYDSNVVQNIPAWSLAALLGVLPKICYFVKDHTTYLILGKPKDKWCALYWDTTGMQDGEQTLADNPVDACYELILKLHELKML